MIKKKKIRNCAAFRNNKTKRKLVSKTKQKLVSKNIRFASCRAVVCGRASKTNDGIFC